MVDKPLRNVWPTTSRVDPYPLWLLVLNRVGLVEWVWEIINTFLQEGVVQTTLKDEAVQPLPKKEFLDLSSLNNYCLVASIPLFG